MLRFILCPIHHQHITFTIFFFSSFFISISAGYVWNDDKSKNRFKNQQVQAICLFLKSQFNRICVRSFERTTDIELVKELSLSNIIIQIDRINFKWRKQKKQKSPQRKSVDWKYILKTNFRKIILWELSRVFRCS